MKLPSKSVVVGYYLPALVVWLLCLAANWTSFVVLDVLGVAMPGVLIGYVTARFVWDRRLNRAWKKLYAASEAELVKGCGYNALMLGSRCFAVRQVYLGKDPTELPICPDPGCDVCERDELVGEHE